MVKETIAEPTGNVNSAVASETLFGLQKKHVALCRTCNVGSSHPTQSDEFHLWQLRTLESPRRPHPWLYGYLGVTSTVSNAQGLRVWDWETVCTASVTVR